jgi:hypothetical protein
MKKLICVRCGVIGTKKDFYTELDNKGSGEWVCQDCADDLKSKCDMEECDEP